MSTDDKFTYMIRQDFTMSGNTKRINSILVHPLTAVGIAMWMSPNFGSEVKDIFLRFVEGDAKLIQQTLQNLNISTGKINNIETTADPDTNEISMIISTFEKNDYMAKIKNQRMKNAIQQLLDEKNGVITKQKCRIDELLTKMDENDAKAEERFNRLMNKTEEFSNKADTEYKKAEISRQKLDRVLPQRVETNKLETGERQQVLILHDSDAKGLEYNLYVLRVQQRKINPAISRIRNKYGNNIHRIYTIDQPNAVTFWNTIKTTLKGNIQKDLKTNWFILTDMTLTQFKDKLNELDCARQE
jgi:hypothetical protein